MGKRLKKIKKIKNIHIHHEGTRTLVRSAILFLIILALLYYFLPWREVFYAALFIFVVVYCIMLNFFQCPIRRFGYDTTGVVVAPADGRVVVLEEVEENEYFHDRRLMVSIFMSLIDVHANWVPLDGTVKLVTHHKGNFHRAWLPKASEENERSTILITAPNGTEVLVRQVAGAMAHRIVTYVQPEEDCYIDEHLGFIKFGSRVDIYLPLGTPVDVTVGQRTVGNETVIAHLENEMTETEETEQ